MRISVFGGGAVHSCPVCGYDRLRRPPRHFTICPSCGTEFEYDDFGVTREEVEQRRAELRARWVAAGPRWHSRVIPEPANWNPVAQLVLAELSFQLPSGGMARVEMTESRGDMVLVNA